MTFLEKVKKIFENSEDKKPEPSIKEELSLEQLKIKVESRLNELGKVNTEIKKSIKTNIDKFESEIERGIELLNKVDLSKRKEQEKIKLVVRENLSLYVSYLKKFVFDLKNVEKLDAEEFLNKIFAIFNNFNRSSQLAFEKSTILIGKELELAKNVVGNFLREIKRITENNKPLFEEEKNLHKLKNLFDELKKSNDYNIELETGIKRMNAELSKLEKDSIDIKNKIEKIKASSEYQSDIQNKENKRKKDMELEKDIQLLKQKINFKELFRVYHTDHKKSQLIKDYGNNFKFALETDTELDLADLLKDTHDIDVNNIKSIQERIFISKEPFFTKTDEEISALEKELEKAKDLYHITKEDINHGIKKKEKLLVKNSITMKEIEELSKLVFHNTRIL